MEHNLYLFKSVPTLRYFTAAPISPRSQMASTFFYKSYFGQLSASLGIKHFAWEPLKGEFNSFHLRYCNRVHLNLNKLNAILVGMQSYDVHPLTLLLSVDWSLYSYFECLAVDNYILTNIRNAKMCWFVTLSCLNYSTDHHDILHLRLLGVQKGLRVSLIWKKVQCPRESKVIDWNNLN